MVYGHMVKYNGQYYPAGTDVPVGDTTVIENKVSEIEVEIQPEVKEVPHVERRGRKKGR